MSIEARYQYDASGVYREMVMYSTLRNIFYCSYLKTLFETFFFPKKNFIARISDDY